MNIKDLTSPENAVSAATLFESENTMVKVVQILQGEQLKEHVSKVPALLVCVIGEAVFEDKKGLKETLLPGDYIKIVPMVKHLVNASKDSQLILIK